MTIAADETASPKAQGSEVIAEVTGAGCWLGGAASVAPCTTIPSLTNCMYDLHEKFIMSLYKVTDRHSMSLTGQRQHQPCMGTSVHEATVCVSYTCYMPCASLQHCSG